MAMHIVLAPTTGIGMNVKKQQAPTEYEEQFFSSLCFVNVSKRPYLLFIWSLDLLWRMNISIRCVFQTLSTIRTVHTFIRHTTTHAHSAHAT